MIFIATVVDWAIVKGREDPFFIKKRFDFRKESSGQFCARGGIKNEKI